ncbi:MAG: enoyl-CoA hydratase/isomerase family protein [Marinibacterium sp.]|nr:enoyl-CoA hydratase/isomerase family protein [Marinibacterium sp.]
MTPEFITFHQDANVGIITLNRPPQNRCNRQFAFELGEAVKAAAASTARAVVIRSAGDHFCCGGDFREWPEFDTYMKRRERWQLSNGALIALENLPVPTIAEVHGDAMGFGFELALHVDLVIAAESARFRFPEATIAVFPLAGGAQRIAERAGRAVAARLVMLTEVLPAPEALRLNIIAEVVADDALRARVDAVAESLSNGATRAHAATKMMLNAWSAGGVPAADVQMFEHIPNILVTDDVTMAVEKATEAFNKGLDRPVYEFKGT